MQTIALRRPATLAFFIFFVASLAAPAPSAAALRCPALLTRVLNAFRFDVEAYRAARGRYAAAPLTAQPSTREEKLAAVAEALGDNAPPYSALLSGEGDESAAFLRSIKVPRGKLTPVKAMDLLQNIALARFKGERRGWRALLARHRATPSAAWGWHENFTEMEKALAPEILEILYGAGAVRRPGPWQKLRLMARRGRDVKELVVYAAITAYFVQQGFPPGPPLESPNILRFFPPEKGYRPWPARVQAAMNGVSAASRALLVGALMVITPYYGGPWLLHAAQAMTMTPESISAYEAEHADTAVEEELGRWMDSFPLDQRPADAEIAAKRAELEVLHSDGVL